MLQRPAKRGPANAPRPRSGPNNLHPRTTPTRLITLTSPATKLRVKKQEDAITFYEPEVFERLVEGARAKSPASYVCILLAGEAGLRRGELIALRWSDLVFERNTIEIKSSVWKGLRGPPKGGQPRRVPMTPRLREALLALPRESQNVLVRESGEQATNALIINLLNVAQRGANLPITYGPHVLRHTYCTGLLLAGVDLRTVQKLPGHADLAATAKYLHCIQDAERFAMDKLAAHRAAVGTGTDLAPAPSPKRRKPLSFRHLPDHHCLPKSCVQ